MLRVLLIITAALGLLLTGIWGVTRLLDRSTVSLPVAEHCVATSESGSWELDTEQSANAALIAVRALELEMPARAATIALATAYQESKIRNIDYGDRDSLGLFQQRPSQGWGTEDEVRDPVYAAKAFYRALAKVSDYQDMTVTEAAQAVQRSGYPEAYSDHEDFGRAWASALHGYSEAALTCALRPVTSDASVSARTQTLLARVARDLPSVDAVVAEGSTTVTLDVAAATRAFGFKDSDSERIGWALAQWAVAVAAETDIVQVTVGNTTWLREPGTWSTLRPSDGPEDLVLTVAPATASATAE